MTPEMIQRTADGEIIAVAWFDDFFGENRFAALSNFYVGEPLLIPEWSSEPFMTGEHAFAAMKADYLDDFKLIQNAPGPDKAKMLGRNVRLRQGWEMIKLDVMMAILRTKFTLDRLEGEVLLSTDQALLLEGTYWDDEVWGVNLNKAASPYHAPGRNWLGTLLMARRAELVIEQVHHCTHKTGVHNATFANRK